MFKSASNKFVLVTFAALLSLVACSNSEDSSDVIEAANDLLKYVPADSPYVFASIAPLPDDVMDKLEPQIDRILQSYEVILRETVKQATAEIEAEGGDSEDAQTAVTVLNELSSLMSIDGLRGAGFERESRAVLYGNGLLPVLRVEVSDGALFVAAIERMEESAGEKMEIVTIAGSAVRFVDADELKILVAVSENQVAVSFAPSTFTDEQIGELLGLNEPDSNGAIADVLQDIYDEYSYDNYFVGYIDIAGIAKTLTGDAGGLDTALMALMAEEEGHEEMSAVCRDEIREMAGIAPRMVMGYKKISVDRFESQMVIELRDDIAAGLKLWPAAVPGLGGDPGGLMSFGFSMDVMAVRNFYEAQLDALDADPFMCEEFGDLQAAVQEGRVALQQPVPPMVYDFRGMLAVVDDIEGLDLMTQTPPTSVDGQFLFAMANAPALISMGTMMSPELAGLNLQADEKPVLVDLPQAQMAGGDVYIAMNDDAIALSIGEGAEAKLGDMFYADAGENGTILNFSMDAARYYSFMSEAIALAEYDDDEEQMSPEFQAAVQEMMQAIADIYDRMYIDIRLTDAGIVIDGVETLAD